jgi:hypothetical protein
MALTSTGFKLNVVLGCKNDKTMNANYNLVAASHAIALTATTAILTALGNVSAGVVKAYSLTERYEEDTYIRPTSSDAEYGDTALLATNIEDLPTKIATIRIPMPKTAIFSAPEGITMDTVNTANAAVIAYHALFKGLGSATISDGEAADMLISGVRS